MSKYAIQIEKLNFSYPQKKENLFCFKDFSLNIESGSFVCITGCNGSGKTTLAELIDGLLIAQSGSIKIDGTELTQDENILFEIRKNIGLVCQNPENSFVSDIVEEEVAFGPENLAVEQDELRRRVEEALETVNLSGFEKKSISELSWKQKQKVSIAAVLSMQGRILIFDEVYGKEMCRIISKLVSQKKYTLVVMTHDRRIATMAERLIILQNGTVIADDKPLNLTAEFDLI